MARKKKWRGGGGAGHGDKDPHATIRGLEGETLRL